MSFSGDEPNGFGPAVTMLEEDEVGAMLDATRISWMVEAEKVFVGQSVLIGK